MYRIATKNTVRPDKYTAALPRHCDYHTALVEKGQINVRFGLSSHALWIVNGSVFGGEQVSLTVISSANSYDRHA